jgi:putative transposase
MYKNSSSMSDRKRYRLIDKLKLQELLGVDNEQKLKAIYREQIEDSLCNGNLARESCWTESVAVGSMGFVEKIKNELGIKTAHRKIVATNKVYKLQEPGKSYTLNFTGKMSSIRVKILKS